MFKKDLIEAVAKTTGETKALAEKMISAVFENMQKALKKGDKVTIMGFGSFDKVKRAAREGRNPQTGEKLKIKARNAIKFSAGKDLKESVN